MTHATRLGIRGFAKAARWLADRVANEPIGTVTPGERAELCRHRDELRAIAKRLDALAENGAAIGEHDVIELRAESRARSNG